MLNSLLVLTLASHDLWPNSTENVHTFLTFDSGVPLAAINASALAQLDFVSAAKDLFSFLVSISIFSSIDIQHLQYYEYLGMGKRWHKGGKVQGCKTIVGSFQVRMCAFVCANSELLNHSLSPLLPATSPDTPTRATSAPAASFCTCIYC